MNQSDYEEFVESVWFGPPDKTSEMAFLGLVGETGELAEKFKKRIRDGTNDTDGILKEIGDVFYYLTKVSNIVEVSISDAALDDIPQISESAAVVGIAGRACGIMLAADDLFLKKDLIAEHVMWIARILNKMCLQEFGENIGLARDKNVEKLRSRKERSVLSGSGDSR